MTTSFAIARGQAQRALMVGSLLVACNTGSPLIAGGQCRGGAVDSTIIRALATGPGERVTISADSAPHLFPGVVFRQGRRTPLTTSFEEIRPKAPTVAIRGSDCVLVSRYSDLPAAWVLAIGGERVSVASARERVPALAVLTGLLTSAQLLSSTEQAREQLAPEQLDSLTAMKHPFVPPTATEVGDSISVRFFGDLTSGVYEFNFTIQRIDGPRIVWTKLLSSVGL